MEDQKKEEIGRFFLHLWMRLDIDYGIAPNQTPEMKELIEESILLGKTPDQVAKELAEQYHLSYNLAKLN